MLNDISIDLLADQIHSDNPSWTIEAAKNQASDYISRWNDCFSNLVKSFLNNGTEDDFQYGEFSIHLIKALRHKCDYLTAIDLLNSYMDDPINGKAKILRR